MAGTLRHAIIIMELMNDYSYKIISSLISYLIGPKHLQGTSHYWPFRGTIICYNNIICYDIICNHVFLLFHITILRFVSFNRKPNIIILNLYDGHWLEGCIVEFVRHSSQNASPVSSVIVTARATTVFHAFNHDLRIPQHLPATFQDFIYWIIIENILTFIYLFITANIPNFIS